MSETEVQRITVVASLQTHWTYGMFQAALPHLSLTQWVRSGFHCVCSPPVVCLPTPHFVSCFFIDYYYESYRESMFINPSCTGADEHGPRRGTCLVARRLRSTVVAALPLFRRGLLWQPRRERKTIKMAISSGC